jgi:hypothetical protein
MIIINYQAMPYVCGCGCDSDLQKRLGELYKEFPTPQASRPSIVFSVPSPCSSNLHFPLVLEFCCFWSNICLIYLDRNRKRGLYEGEWHVVAQ